MGMDTISTSKNSVTDMGIPPVEQCHLSEKKLSAVIASRYIHGLSLSQSERKRRSEEAFFNFGKPGRAPKKASSLLSQIAHDNGWMPHLKTAALSSEWAQIVGPAVGAATHVESFRAGELIIRASSTAWLTQLTFMKPQLEEQVRAYLAPIDIDKITLVGPNSYTFKHGLYTVPGRGPRDTWG